MSEDAVKHLQELTADWLESHGYDGLVEVDGECACVIADLMPCGAPAPDCSAGYQVEAPESSEGDFIITTDKGKRDAV